MRVDVYNHRGKLVGSYTVNDKGLQNLLLRLLNRVRGEVLKRCKRYADECYVAVDGGNYMAVSVVYRGRRYRLVVSIDHNVPSPELAELGDIEWWYIGTQLYDEDGYPVTKGRVPGSRVWYTVVRVGDEV